MMRGLWSRSWKGWESTRRLSENALFPKLIVILKKLSSEYQPFHTLWAGMIQSLGCVDPVIIDGAQVQGSPPGMKKLVPQPQPVVGRSQPPQFSRFRHFGMFGMLIYRFRYTHMVSIGRIKVGGYEIFITHGLLLGQGTNLLICELNEEKLGDTPF